MKNEMMKTEIRQAIAAGEVALSSLYRAQEQLQSARKWGIFDMLGGGMISDFIKHSRMSDASSSMEEARNHLMIFQRELQDVDVPAELRMEIGGFLSFADFFFDGLIADYMVQSKIADAREQVEDGIERVKNILEQLKNMYGYGKEF
ncbi:MAG: hypothetical protein KH828_07095 [Clostridiales bacterium]|nr:hypothetical protein [Clostridiales bacterium]